MPFCWVCITCSGMNPPDAPSSKASPHPAPPRTLLNDPITLWVPRTQANISSTLVWMVCPLPRSFTRVNYVSPSLIQTTEESLWSSEKRKEQNTKKKGRGEKEKRKKTERRRVGEMWRLHTHDLCTEHAHYYYYEEKIKRQAEGDQKVRTSSYNCWRGSAQHRTTLGAATWGTELAKTTDPKSSHLREKTPIL